MHFIYLLSIWNSNVSVGSHIFICSVWQPFSQCSSTAEALAECMCGPDSVSSKPSTGAVKRLLSLLQRTCHPLLRWWGRTMGGVQALERFDLNYKFIFTMYQLNIFLLFPSTLFLHVCQEKKITSLVFFRRTSFALTASYVFVCHNGGLPDALVWI